MKKVHDILNQYKGNILKIAYNHNIKIGYHYDVTVWNDEKSKIEYYTCGEDGDIKEDANNEIIKKAMKYKINCKLNDIFNHYNYLNIEDLMNENIKVNVKVVKGRKVPINTIGEVIGIYDNKYDSSNKSLRLLLNNGSKVYTYIKNVELYFSNEDKKRIKIKVIKDTLKEFKGIV